jgi:hypothetical protein
MRPIPKETKVGVIGLYESGEFTMDEIAAETGVSKGAVVNILKNTKRGVSPLDNDRSPRHLTDQKQEKNYSDSETYRSGDANPLDIIPDFFRSPITRPRYRDSESSIVDDHGFASSQLTFKQLIDSTVKREFEKKAVSVRRSQRALPRR